MSAKQFHRLGCNSLPLRELLNNLIAGSYLIISSFFLLIFLCVMPCTQGLSQSTLDSLKRVIKTTAEGPGKVKLYGNISWQYASGQRDLKNALLYADSMKFLAEEIGDKKGLAQSSFYFGFIARLTGDYHDALRYFDQCIAFATQEGDSDKVAKVLYQAGAVNQELGNYEKSLATYYRILAIREKQKDPHAIGYTFNAIGVIQKKMKRHEEAIESYRKALVVMDSLGRKKEAASTLMNMGNIFRLEDQLDSARIFYERALQIYNETGTKNGTASALSNMGALFNSLNKLDSALVFHLKALAIWQGLFMKQETAASLNRVGYTYFRKKKYDQAEKYLQQALVIAELTGAKPLLRDIHQNLSELFSEREALAKALKHHKLFVAYKDSVLNEETTKELNELQVRYNMSEKDKQILLLNSENEVKEKENQRQATLKNAFIAGTFLMLIVAGLTYFISRQRLKNQSLVAVKNAQLKELSFSKQATELEMKALRAQINPHFLFNCMNSINQMIVRSENDKASLYLTKFSKLIRLIVENGNATKVALEDELALLEAYIQMESLRFAGKIQYQINVAPHIDRSATYIPPMVLQPFVENAIWHGLMHKEKPEDGMIQMVISERDDMLVCSIEDNGVGTERSKQLQEKSLLKKKSVGMTITEERLKLLTNGQLQEYVKITDVRDSVNKVLGTQVQVSIPLF
jgi:tetratricopeptide (TPR) repeat protein